jgi:hypothetical protein
MKEKSRTTARLLRNPTIMTANSHAPPEAGSTSINTQGRLLSRRMSMGGRFWSRSTYFGLKGRMLSSMTAPSCSRAKVSAAPA